MAKKKSSPLKKNQNYFVFVPALGQGTGRGHLVRCQRLLASLKQGIILLVTWGRRGLAVKSQKSQSYQNPCQAGTEEKELELDIKRQLAKEGRRSAKGSPAQLPTHSIVVLDRRKTEPEIIKKFSGFPLIGLDEGGKASTFCHYLISSLPQLGNETVKVNEEVSPITLKNLRPPQDLSFPFKRALLSFGGEDPAGLSQRLLEALLDKDLFKPQDIILVEGPSFKKHDWPAPIKVVRAPKDLRPLLKSCDLVFTHFGLTLYEALALAKPVILFNPTPYHRHLSWKAGIPEIGVKRLKLNKLMRLLNQKELFEREIENGQEFLKKRPQLAEVLKGLTRPQLLVCPLCQTGPTKAVARFPRRTYFRCPNCSLIWLSLWQKPRPYTKSYFFAEYKAQYGRSYLEDFKQIKMLALERLKLLARFKAGGRLLDIGSAYGPFLQAASAEGYEVLGIEINRAAVEYVQKRLKLACYCADFQRLKVGTGLAASFDVVSMWYTLEHFSELEVVLTKVSALLKKGGIFVFATPSATGISARKGLRDFLAQSPADHFTLWAPAMARKALKRFGFKVVKIRITGHHPERFLRSAHQGLMRQVFLFISKLFRLGDTFEVYARKI